MLAAAVRRNFNSAAVNEIDVVVDLVVRVKLRGECCDLIPSAGLIVRVS